ncbi:hypothetical protein, partial [Janthinobacterium sp. TND4EL3]|uniref:hypothetical protein n=1 Tax=Janthinobacterium sp. TND4EL3 TaxID=1907311 RepID=UPI001BAEE92B
VGLARTTKVATPLQLILFTSEIEPHAPRIACSHPNTPSNDQGPFLLGCNAATLTLRNERQTGEAEKVVR